MFSFLKKQLINQKQITFSLQGLHCSGCANEIDLALEDLKGVFSSKTNYAKSRTTVKIDPSAITQKEIIRTMQSLGYTAKEI